MQTQASASGNARRFSETRSRRGEGDDALANPLEPCIYRIVYSSLHCILWVGIWRQYRYECVRGDDISDSCWQVEGGRA